LQPLIHLVKERREGGKFTKTNETHLQTVLKDHSGIALLLNPHGKESTPHQPSVSCQRSQRHPRCSSFLRAASVVSSFLSWGKPPKTPVSLLSRVYNRRLPFLPAKHYYEKYFSGKTAEKESAGRAWPALIPTSPSLLQVPEELPLFIKANYLNKKNCSNGGYRFPEPRASRLTTVNRL
jgi:hypothetical protein